MVKRLHWSAFNNAYHRRGGCNRTESETRLLKEQPVFFFGSFNATGQYQHHYIKILGLRGFVSDRHYSFNN